MGKLKGDWGRSQLEALGEMMGFDLDDPLRPELAKKARTPCSYGLDEEIIVKMDFSKVDG